MATQAFGGKVPGPAGCIILQANMDETFEERASGEDHFPPREDLTDLAFYSSHLAVFNQQPLNTPLAQG